MAIVSTSTNSATSQTSGVTRVAVASWAQNDELIVTHAKDPMGARQVTIWTGSTKVQDRLDSVYTIRHISATQTGIKALAASPVAVDVVVTVPAT